MRLSLLLNLQFLSWILSLTPSILILFSLVSILWFITLSDFISSWYCRLFLSFCYTSFLFRLLFLPRQLFIPRVDSRCPFSFLLSPPPKECPYNDLNIYFFGETTSLSGLLELFLLLWKLGFLKGLALVLFLSSSAGTILALCKSKFYVSGMFTCKGCTINYSWLFYSSQLS